MTRQILDSEVCAGIKECEIVELKRAGQSRDKRSERLKAQKPEQDSTVVEMTSKALDSEFRHRLARGRNCCTGRSSGLMNLK